MTTYELEKLKEVMTLFYKITHVVITLFNTDLEPMLDVGKWEDYCLAIGKDPEQLEKCRMCDRIHAKESDKYREPHIYCCHAGIAEAVTPIYVDNMPVGYIMIGKFRDADGEHSSEETVIAAAEKYGLDREEMLRLWGQLELLDKDALTSTILLLKMFVGYIKNEKLFHTIQNTFAKQIEKYVNSHLMDKITVETMCTDLHLAYHELYALFRKYFKSSPHEYIDRVRFQRAQEMLTTTQMSISDIAIALGFSKSSIFSSFFKIKMKAGITPTQYRNQHK